MTQPGFQQDPTVHIGKAADRRLTELGIDPLVLFDALDAGDAAAQQPDEYSPVMAAGIVRWLETTRVVRRGLVRDGWHLNDDRNSPRVMHPDGGIALVAVSGNEGTGLEEETPRSARPRGLTSARAVQINIQLELDLNWSPSLPDLSAEKSDRLATWFLLYHRTKGRELRAEVSLPVEISERGVIRAWSERILLPARTYDPEVAIPKDAGGGDDIAFEFAESL